MKFYIKVKRLKTTYKSYVLCGKKILFLNNILQNSFIRIINHL